MTECALLLVVVLGACDGKVSSSDAGGRPDADLRDSGADTGPGTIVDGLFDAEADFSTPYVDVEGVRYGADAERFGPIGGGPGYGNGVDPSDCSVSVASRDDLIAALAAASAGDVVCIEGTAELDFTDVVMSGQAIRLPGGVTLASDRGRGGSLGALLFSTTLDTARLVEVTGADARITGLRLMGPDPLRREEHWCEAYCSDGPMLGPDHYYSIPNSRGISVTHDRLEIDNCEIAGFSHAGVLLEDGEGHRVHHNFIHHNQRDGLGYGVSHDTAFSVIEANLFDYQRHSIAGTGRPGSGYEARHNVERGHSISHNFDMHGGLAREDGTDIAGTYTHVVSNTFFELPGESLETAIRIRGIPEDMNLFELNWFAQASPSAAIVEGGRSTIGDNAYGMPDPTIVAGP